MTVGSNEIGLSGSLGLLAPTVTFKANPDDLIDVTCGASGTVRLTDNGASLIQVELSITTSLTVGIDVLVTPKSLAVRTELKSRCQFSPDKEQNDRADNGQDKTGWMKA